MKEDVHVVGDKSCGAMSGEVAMGPVFPQNWNFVSHLQLFFYHPLAVPD